MKWTLKDLEKLAKAKKIVSFKVSANKDQLQEQRKEKVKKTKAYSRSLQQIKLILEAAGIDYKTEYYFAKPRMFRFDIAIPDRKIAIEYEGIFSEKSRHTSVKGYTRDADKYNIAVQKGWKVLRYTAMNVSNFESDLKAIFHAGDKNY